jgi:hypothetical protein
MLYPFCTLTIFMKCHSVMRYFHVVICKYLICFATGDSSGHAGLAGCAGR